MKIELNFETKEVILKSTMTLHELFKTLNKLDLDLKEWKIVNDINNTLYYPPIITNPPPYYPQIQYFATTHLSNLDDKD